MHAQSNPLWLGNMFQMDYSTRRKQVASMTWSKWTQLNRVCSMRLATNTRYTLCTVKSGYIDICHECHVRGGATLLVWHHQSLEGQLYQGLIESGLWSMHPWLYPLRISLASPKSGGTVIPRANRVRFVVNAILVVPTQNQSEYNSHSRHTI